LQGPQAATAASNGNSTVQQQQQVDQPGSSHGFDGVAAGLREGGRAANTGPVVSVDRQAPTAAVPDDVSPQSVYLECCEQQPVNNLRKGGQRSRPTSPLPLETAQSAAAQVNTADAAVQCDANWPQQQQEGDSGFGAGSGGVQQAAVQWVDAGCQVSLLHVAGLPAVGPPIQCRCCPVLQTQLRETQQRLENVMEQYKQVQSHAPGDV
jgi:hypothetical protein